jgi:hypothetical protein
MPTNLPSIPTISGNNIDPQVFQVLSALTANVVALRDGNVALPYVTAEQLSGAVSNAADLFIGDTPSLEPPIALDNLEVIGGILFNMLTWGQLPGNVDHINIYRAASNDRTISRVVGTTQFCIWADYIPEGVNTKYYYWLRVVSKAGIEGSWNLVDGHVSTTGTSATPMGIGDKQVGTISASKIYCLTLAALSANLGTVTAGKLNSFDNMFQVNLTDKYIIIGSGTANPGHISPWYGSRYIAISSGNIIEYEWTGTKYTDSKSLRVIEVGTAYNNSTVVLTKFYRTQPKIIVSPDSIQCYSAAHKEVDQTLQIAPTSIREVTAGSGIWQFQAVAQLVMAAGSDTKSPNWNSGGTAGGSIQSGTYATPTNTRSLSVNVAFSSSRGTGTAPDFYNRLVSYSLYARTAGTGAYSIRATTNVPLGATLSAVNGTLSYDFGYAGTWEFYVVATYSDAGGTFASGTGGYDYAADVVLRLAGDTALANINSSGATVAQAMSFTLPAFTPTAGYSVYNVNYTASYGYYISATAQGSGSSGAGTASAGISGLINDSVSASGYSDTRSTGAQNVPSPMGSISASNTSYNPGVSGFATISATGSTGGGGAVVGWGVAQFKVFAAGTQAVIQQRKPILNSATASNSLSLINYTSTLSSAVTLANGTLNYTAIL